MDPHELERHIDRRLARFTTPRAPESLLPRVMAAVRAREAAVPMSRDWRTWPLALQAASMAAGVLLIVGIVRAWPIALLVVEGLAPGFVHDASARAQDVALDLESFSAAASAIWRSMLRPTAIALLVVVVPMFAACAVFGTALQRVALGGTSR